MEEMNKEVMETVMTEIVEEVAEKLTFKDNLTAYALAGTFAVGAGTICYLAYKGGKKLGKMLYDKRKQAIESDEEIVVDVEEEDIQDIKDNGSEQK